MVRYVNVGCGFLTGPSWENYDSSPTLRFERLPIIGRLYMKNATRFPENAHYADITRAPIGVEDSADAIFCSHMLEHLTLAQMRSALSNMFEMLKSGGVLRIIVPDLEWRAKLYTEELGDPLAAHRFMEIAGLGARSGRDSILSRLKSAFANDAHFWMYDEASLTKELSDHGFVQIRRCKKGDCEIAVFGEVEHEGRFSHYDRFPELAVKSEEVVHPR